MTERISSSESFAPGDAMTIDELGAWGEDFVAKIAAKLDIAPGDPRFAHRVTINPDNVLKFYGTSVKALNRFIEQYE